MTGTVRRVPLDGGRELVVRAATAADADGVVRLYERLPLDDRHRRFFAGGRPPREWIDRWVRQGERGGAMLVAVAHDAAAGTSEIVGDAGYGPPHAGSTELGITVAADWRGWLGPFLLDALVEVARDSGIAVLEAEVLTENRAMLRLLSTRGDVMLPLDDFHTTRVAIPTTGRTPVWPPWMEHPRLLVEVPGGRWRGSVAAVGAGLHVVGCPRRVARCPALRGEPCPLVAGADVVVCVAREGDADSAALLAAHRAVHADRRILVDDGAADVATLAARAAALVAGPA